MILALPAYHAAGVWVSLASRLFRLPVVAVPVSQPSIRTRLRAMEVSAC